MIETGGSKETRAFALTDGWRMATFDSSPRSTPRDIAERDGWIPAIVPGTAAQALEGAGLWRREAPDKLHDRDIWYRVPLRASAGSRLRFDGLASIADIWLENELASSSKSMFQPVEIALDCDFAGELFIAFRSLETFLAGLKGRRARWRTALIDNPALRFARTTLLGHMPGWCPAVDIVGPYRPVSLVLPEAISDADVTVSARCTGVDGVLRARVAGAARLGGLALHCGGAYARFSAHGEDAICELRLPRVEQWLPHTHGEPRLYRASIECDGDAIWSRGIGFRVISVNHGGDGNRFFLDVNGERVFARGVNWTPSDIVSLPCDAQTYRRELTLMRDAGFNMVRVPGITLFEAPEFFEIADELGMMIWQDLPLANFDYPFDDPEFRATIEAETAEFLRATSHCCSLVALCGGSEIEQQAAMLGLPREKWEIEYLRDELAAFVRARRPDILYVPNSPSGGELPFVVNNGVGHYYGTGAYLRPLEDARRADVSFATECLTFSNVPDARSLQKDLADPNSRRWKELVPRDRGASWDFEDVREHYMNLLYGVDCAALKRDDPKRYLDFARAAPGEVMESTFAEWRRKGSRTGGGLVFLWKDLQPGAGWGIVNAGGRPKSVYHALKRAFRPVQVLLTDEGVNGLAVHCINERAESIEARLRVACLADGRDVVVEGSRVIRLAPRENISIPAVELFGAFFDANYAYRFGPPAHDVVVATLREAEAELVVAEAFHFPLGRGNSRSETGLAASLVEDENAFWIDISCAKFAQTVAIDDPRFMPEENYFHLQPGIAKRILMRPAIAASGARPHGSVRALNGVETIEYR